MTLAKFYEQVLAELYERLFEHYGFSNNHVSPSVCLSMARILQYRPNLGDFPVPKDLDVAGHAEMLYEMVNIPLTASKKVTIEDIIHYGTMVTVTEAGLVIIRQITDDFCRELEGIAADARQSVRDYSQMMELLMSEKAAEC